jgi:hypothetical protein
MSVLWSVPGVNRTSMLSGQCYCTVAMTTPCLPVMRFYRDDGFGASGFRDATVLPLQLC